MSDKNDNFDQINAGIETIATGLISDGARPEDISGALLANGIAMLMAAEGREAAASYLFDVAARIKSGSEIDYRRQ